MEAKLYLASDENGAAFFFTEMPERSTAGAMGVWTKKQKSASDQSSTQEAQSSFSAPASTLLMFNGYLPKVTWADEPKEITLTWQ